MSTIKRANKIGRWTRGSEAIARAKQGATLYVLNAQLHWVEAGPDGLARAERMDPHGQWIYGVKD